MKSSLNSSWRLIVALTLVVVLAPFPTRQAKAAGVSPASYLAEDGSLMLPADFSGALDLTGWDVGLDSQRGLVFQPAAAIDGAWSALNDVGTGLNGSGNTIALDGGTVYVGGFFTDAAGDPDADNIVKLEGGAWTTLGGANTGLNQGVRVVVIDGGVIYAGGTFTDAGGDPDADNIAKFESGAWSSLGGAGTGLNSGVLSITIDGGIIYAGGNFTNAGGDPDADRIAQFSGGSWSSLGGANSDLNNRVEVIEVHGGIIYAGGAFLNAGLDPDANFIAKFESGAWSSLGGAGTGLSGPVLDLVISGAVIYAAGDFVNAGGDADADYIAKFESGAWSSLGGSGSGLPGYVEVLLISGGIIYVGGDFDNAGGDPNADRIAKFSDGAWSSLNGANTGLSDIVNDMVIVDNVLYAVGSFENAGGDADTDYAAQFGLVFSKPQTTTQQISRVEIATSGTTTLELGDISVSLPAEAVTGLGSCSLSIQDLGNSGDFGFTLNDSVWDVDITCDGANQHIFLAPITICIRPEGSTDDKKIFHRGDAGGSWDPLATLSSSSGMICAHTRTLSLFTLGSFSLPNTGFAPNVAAELNPKAAYASTGLHLSIPKLGLATDIVGVPQGINGWDVSWLGESAGFLHGTAFPTLAGNTVITAHVWGADNQPGPFAGLHGLRYGDHISINAWGQTYTYEVRTNTSYSPSSLSPLATTDHDWVTLITCQGFDEVSGEYLFRRVVRAVLISID
ncbi:MAG: sortase [Anaerolineales bacterium]|nr:MAG: sortase [Anaerolineales bacterium]